MRPLAPAPDVPAAARVMSILECVMTTFRGTLKTLNEFVKEPVSGVDAMHGSAHVRVQKSESQRREE